MDRMSMSVPDKGKSKSTATTRNPHFAAMEETRKRKKAERRAGAQGAKENEVVSSMQLRHIPAVKAGPKHLSKPILNSLHQIICILPDLMRLVFRAWTSLANFSNLTS